MRRAISLAIDANKLVEIIMLGLGAELPLSYYHPDLPWARNLPSAYDANAAAAMLDAAGLGDSDGDGVREWEGQPTDFEILCDVNNAVEVRSTELIMGWLADVGIGSRQKCIDIDTAVTFIWPSFVAVPDPDYDMAIWGWSSGTQFQRGFIRFLTHGDLATVGWANLTGLSDPDLDALTDEYVSNPDPARQEELNRLIQEASPTTCPSSP